MKIELKKDCDQLKSILRDSIIRKNTAICEDDFEMFYRAAMAVAGVQYFSLAMMSYHKEYQEVHIMANRAMKIFNRDYDKFK